MPKEITGYDLELDGKGRGETDDPATGKPKEHDSSHLIANIFGGTGEGKKEAANLVAASGHYNKKVMRKAEINIENWAKEMADELGYKKFNMTVTVRWGKIEPKKIVDEIQAWILAQEESEKQKLDYKDLSNDKMHERIVKNLDDFTTKVGLRCEGVTYRAWIETGTGDEIDTTEEIGPDIWIGV